MRRLLLLGAALLLLGGSGRAHPTPTPTAFNSASSYSHTLCYFYTGVSEPGQGLPRFIIVGYVDDQLFIQYDSDTRRVQPRVPWMEKVGEGHPQYWDGQTQVSRNAEQRFRVGHLNLQKYYNQTGGFHTWQWMYSCELRGNERKGGYLQFGYDGRDYLALDKETLTWTAADVPAQNTKRKWEAEPAIAQRDKAYLEEECIEWLQKYLDYGKETLLRTEPPVGKVTRVAKATNDGIETLVCEAHGFYPKEIDATWRKDGEILEYYTFHRGVVPNSDGTYHTWLSIDIDSKERDLYRCYVDHAGLPEPLVLAWEEPGGERQPVNMALLGAILGVVAVLGVMIAGITCWIRKKQKTAVNETVLEKNQNYNSPSHPLSVRSDSSEKALSAESDGSEKAPSLRSDSSEKQLLQ